MCRAFYWGCGHSVMHGVSAPLGSLGRDTKVLGYMSAKVERFRCLSFREKEREMGPLVRQETLEYSPQRQENHLPFSADNRCVILLQTNVQAQNVVPSPRRESLIINNL